jgi:hypothetical protein
MNAATIPTTIITTISTAIRALPIPVFPRVLPAFTGEAALLANMDVSSLETAEDLSFPQLILIG